MYFPDLSVRNYFMTKAEQTRLSILQQAFGLIYRQGYQATSIDDILKQMKITKGAFFYHFRAKEDMALAMIREIMYPGMYAAMVLPLQQAGDPLTELYAMMRRLLMQHPLFEVQYGCPAVNLVEEMAPLDETFRTELAVLVKQWQQAIIKCLREGKKAGLVKESVNEQQVAMFIVAGYSGIRNLGKLLGRKCYRTYLKEFRAYLESLR